MDEFILIANPISGKGTGKTVAEQALAALKKENRHGTLKLTTGTGDATRWTQEALTNGIHWIIVCGGDGTLHEVVNTLAGNTTVTLSVLPCGRGNDLATAMNIPRKPHQAIQTLLTGTPKSMDLGYVRSEKGSEHYFTTIATCGYDTEVSRLAASRTTPFAGTASYIYAAIATLKNYTCPHAHIEGDFGTYQNPILLAATGNTHSYGGGFKITPHAQFDDGLFDVCIIRSVSAFTVLGLMITLFWGGHGFHPAVDIHQTRTLTIETDPPVMLYADGEPMCETPATLKILKNKLNILVPQKENKPNA